MEHKQFFGREQDLTELMSLWHKRASSLVVVSGRRRIRQIKTWGMKGVIEYLCRLHKNRMLQHRLIHDARVHPLQPQPGITLFADMTGTGSLSKVMRDLAARLRTANIPYQTYDLHVGPIEIPEEDYKDILTPAKDFRILRYTHAIEMCTNLFPTNLPIKRSRIYFWEFSSGLLEYDTSLANDGTVIAMSDFNYDVFRASCPSNVTIRKILYPFLFNIDDIPTSAEMRDKLGFAADDFIVFFNFDFGTSYHRKNPEDALRAFAQAFANEPKAHFLLKSKNAKRHPDEFAALQKMASDLKVADRVRIITDYLPQRELYGLTNACNVYLSLHRGEGFGLGIAEAMSLGKPAIVTDYSSTTEFCNKDNSIPVPFTMVPVKSGDIDNSCYHYVTEWAQPDINFAANALRELYENPNRRNAMGIAARTFIQSYFSNENFKQSINNFLTIAFA